MRADMTPEDQLCLLLARGQLSLAARRRALELLASPLRWDLLLARAGAHEVTPLVYRNLALADRELGLMAEGEVAARKAVELDRFDPANRALLAEFEALKP